MRRSGKTLVVESFLGKNASISSHFYRKSTPQLMFYCEIFQTSKEKNNNITSEPIVLTQNQHELNVL